MNRNFEKFRMYHSTIEGHSFDFNSPKILRAELKKKKKKIFLEMIEISNNKNQLTKKKKKKKKIFI